MLMRRRALSAGLPLLIVSLLLLGACAGGSDATSTPDPTDETTTTDAHATAMEILAREPRYEGAFVACLFRGYAEGLGVKGAQEQCEVELPKLGGSAGTPLPAGQVSASSGVGLRCPGILAGPAARGGGYVRQYGKDPREPDRVWGEYSWGGSGEFKSADAWFVWRGLSEAESERRKTEAVDRYFEAKGEWGKAFDEYVAAATAAEQARKSGDPAKIQAAEERLRTASQAEDKAHDAMDLALKEAQADPNKAPPNVSDVDPEAAGTCGADALAFLRECDRVDWSTADCADLQAQLHNCADPALIYPDPLDGSIKCGAQLAKPEEVAAALEAWCRERVQYGPDGEDPCSIGPRHGTPESREMALRGWVWAAPGAVRTVCGSPRAYVTEDSCAATFRLSDFGQPSVDEVLLWGLDRLGGPVIILPADPSKGGPRPPLDPPRPA